MDPPCGRRQVGDERGEHVRIPPAPRMPRRCDGPGDLCHLELIGEDRWCLAPPRLPRIQDAKGEAIGNHVRARVVKNKVAAPFKTSEFDIMFDSGISCEGDLVDFGAECGVIAKSGAWFNYGQLRLGQGRDNARLYLLEHKELVDEIKNKILVAKGLIQAT